MTIEFEATFIDVNVNEIKKILKRLKAKKLMPERLMRRYIFNLPIEIKGGWMRVRDEGDKITMSVKQISGEKIDDQKEVELTIDDFDKGVRFLESIGGFKKAYQETRRESWAYDGAKIDIDTWPGLEPFIEVEAETEAIVKNVCQKLNLDYSQAIFGAVDQVYRRKLNISPDLINNKPLITFENPPKKIP